MLLRSSFGSFRAGSSCEQWESAYDTKPPRMYTILCWLRTILNFLLLLRNRTTITRHLNVKLWVQCSTEPWSQSQDFSFHAKMSPDSNHFATKNKQNSLPHVCNSLNTWLILDWLVSLKLAYLQYCPLLYMTQGETIDANNGYWTRHKLVMVMVDALSQVYSCEVLWVLCLF